MMTTTAATLTFARPDGAFGFTDPAVPLDLSIERVIAAAVPRLRLPQHDISTGAALRYSMLKDGAEIRRDLTIDEVFPQREGRVHIIGDFTNARGTGR